MRMVAFIPALFAVLAVAQNMRPAPAQRPPAARQPGQNSIIFWNTSQSSVNLLLQHVPQTNPIRLAQLRQTFHDFQCRAPNLHQQAFAGGNNLLCTLPAGLSASAPSLASSQLPGIILFIADYKHEGRGQSAVDNWSGALMLPFLYHALTIAPRRHTFLFADVEGEAGAKALFNSLSNQERRRIRGVIALDCLGLGHLRYYVNPYDSLPGTQFVWLSIQLQQAALDQQLSSPIFALPGAWFKVDPTSEFRQHNIQSILIFTIDFRHRKVPGSVRDTYASLDPEIYYHNLLRLSVYAVELDRPWPSQTRPRGSTVRAAAHSSH